jgi:FkbM family methyltransferase
MRADVKRVVRACTPRVLRNWLRSPGKSAEWVLNEAKYAAGVRREVEVRPGWRVRSHPSAYPYAYFNQTLDPEQAAEFDDFISACRPGMVLFDIGAHFGLFSLAALKFGGPDSLAVAVDPSPTAARMLKIQAKLNGAGERLQVVRAAVGERGGWQPMVATGVRGAGYFLAPSDHAGGELTRTRAVTLDQLAGDFGARPTHLKIDVEGAEASVLRGARSLLSRPGSPLVFIELHNEIVSARGDAPAETIEELKAHGYESFSAGGVPLSEASILSRPLIRITAAKRGGAGGGA